MGRQRGLAYSPGIDGLRAVAVSAVILYHAQQAMPSSWLPGGFLGVEVFFVISGYLITALIIGEHDRTGALDIRAFWLRRARRLLPALVALLLVSITVVGLVGQTNGSLRDHVGPFRSMWLSAWGYVTNWYQIAAGLEYGDNMGRPPLLRHLWSLAVEEQFYVVWPLVMWLILARGRHRLRVVGTVFALLALAVAAITAIAYRPDDLGRINWLYLATPTRAGGLLLGAALAIFWRPWATVAPASLRRGRTVDALAATAIGVLLWAFTRWHLTTDGPLGSEGYDLLFRGGFLLIGAATLMLLIASTHPASAVGRHLLGARPLVWVGKRSYGLYLWHWPVFQLMRPRGDLSLLDAASPDIAVAWLPALCLRLLVTVLLAEASYRLIEVPIRRGGLLVPLRAALRDGGVRRSIGIAATVVTTVAVVASSSLTFGAVDDLAAGAACDAESATCNEWSDDPATGASTPSPTDTIAFRSSVPTSTTTSATTSATTSTLPGARVSPTTAPLTADSLPPLVIGDSVVKNASVMLRRAGLNVDALVDRHFAAAFDLVAEYRHRNQLGDVIVISLGTSGGIPQDELDRLMTLLSSVPHVVLVTPNIAGRRGAVLIREKLLAAAERYPNVTLADWWSVANDYRWWYEGNEKVAPRDVYFRRDRIHLMPKGQRAFTDLILSEINRVAGS